MPSPWIIIAGLVAFLSMGYYILLNPTPNADDPHPRGHLDFITLIAVLAFAALVIALSLEN